MGCDRLGKVRPGGACEGMSDCAHLGQGSFSPPEKLEPNFPPGT